MPARIELTSTLTCPACGHAKAEVMPTDSCVFFYECEGCSTWLKPLPGDCCVFCSCGSAKCPPIQDARSACCNSAQVDPRPPRRPASRARN